jgi:hypothetical protein
MGSPNYDIKIWERFHAGILIVPLLLSLLRPIVIHYKVSTTFGKTGVLESRIDVIVKGRKKGGGILR